MTERDRKFFNCSEEHEIDLVSDKYKDKEKVKEFIKEKCKDKTIHYWTHEKLSEYLAENGFQLKPHITQTDLVNSISEKLGSKAQAQTAFAAVMNVLSEALKAGDSFAIKGFGTFKIVNRSARKGTNPATGQPMEIPASRSVKFTPSKALKEALMSK